MTLGCAEQSDTATDIKTTYLKIVLKVNIIQTNVQILSEGRIKWLPQQWSHVNMSPVPWESQAL